MTLFQLYVYINSNQTSISMYISKIFETRFQESHMCLSSFEVLGFCILQTVLPPLPVALRNWSMKPSWTMTFWRSWSLSTLERWWTACMRKSTPLSSWLFRRESRGTTSTCLLVSSRCYCYLLLILSWFYKSKYFNDSIEIMFWSLLFYFYCSAHWCIWFSVSRGFIRGHPKWKAPGSDASWDGFWRAGHSL